MAEENTDGKMAQYFRVTFGWTKDKEEESFIIRMGHAWKGTGETMFEMSNLFFTNKKTPISLDNLYQPF